MVTNCKSLGNSVAGHGHTGQCGLTVAACTMTSGGTSCLGGAVLASCDCDCMFKHSEYVFLV